MVVEKERHKTKVVYRGCFQPLAFDKDSPGVPGPSSSRGGGNTTSGKLSEGGCGSRGAVGDYRGVAVASTMLKITVNEVSEAGERAVEEHYEVAGNSPEVNDLLMRLLTVGSLGEDEMQQLEGHLANLLAFAETVAATAGLQR
jgi:hypothetical protein